MPKVVFRIPAQTIEIDVDPERVQQWHGMGIHQRNEDLESVLWENSDRLQWEFDLR